MTDQEAFDKVAKHLLEQGRKSTSDDGCAYRGSEGTKCAIGCLIPDEEYKSFLEGKAVFTLQNSDKITAIQGLNGNLLNKLQFIHDATSVENWPRQLRTTAKYYGLNADVLEDYL